MVYVGLVGIVLCVLWLVMVLGLGYYDWFLYWVVVCMCRVID